MSFLSTAFSGASNSYTPQGSPEAMQAFKNSTSGLQDLATQLKLQSQGQGVNLANAQLAQSTGQNVGQQAALMAGQRGASSNVGLMARQIGQQGANIQQQSANQASVNRLAEQLASQQQLGSVLGTQGQLGSGMIQSNNQIGSNQSAQNAKTNQGLIGGIANAGMGLLGLADGGQIPQVQARPLINWSDNSDWGFNFTSGAKPNAMSVLNKGIPAASAQVLGTKPQIIPDPTKQYAMGGAATRLPFAPMTDYKRGGQVEASSSKQQANSPGNSLNNDKIPAMLSEGEAVIDRETMNDPGPAGQMARALTKHIEAKKGRR